MKEWSLKKKIMNEANWVGDEITDRILDGFAKAEKGDRAVSSVRDEMDREYENPGENGVSGDQSADVSNANGFIPEKDKAPDDTNESELAATVAPTHGERQPKTESGSGLFVSGLLISINVLLLVIAILLVRLTKKLDRTGQHTIGKNSEDTHKDSDNQSGGGSGGNDADKNSASSHEDDRSKDTKPQEPEETKDTSDNHNQKSQGGNEPCPQASDPNFNENGNESPQDSSGKRTSHGGESIWRPRKRYLKVAKDNGEMGIPVLMEVEEGEDAHYVMFKDSFVKINSDMSWYKKEDDRDGGTESKVQKMAFWNRTVKLSALFDLVDENGRSGERLNDNDYVRIMRMEKPARVGRYGKDWTRAEKGRLVFRIDC